MVIPSPGDDVEAQDAAYLAFWGHSVVRDPIDAQISVIIRLSQHKAGRDL